MRSSIACIRCRRSKVKCVNNGIGSKCRACDNAGRECTYPEPIAAGTRRRNSLSGRQDGYGDSERRQRPRKSLHTSGDPMSRSRESPPALLDALNSTMLTAGVWQELYDIFQIHYSADLPFLHPPTFLKPIRQAGMQSGAIEPKNVLTRPPASDEFLLAFLALTARFHPKLVAHFSPASSTRSSNPLIASDYYAAAAGQRLSGNWTDNQFQDIERTQAMLMLGLHEWGMCRGAKAWLIVGSAIRNAQAMGLQYELDLDDEPMSRSLALSSEAERLGINGRRSSISSVKQEGDAFIQQEIRRRTFWSCFIMDRYLSSGKYRPQMLHAKELRIQLPASERSFVFAEKVRTLMLGDDEDGTLGRAEVQSHRQASVMLATTGTPEPTQASSPKSATMQDIDEQPGRLETGSDEALISRYVKILEVYGQVVKWSCLGGRRVEEHPPWDKRSRWSELRKQCQTFKATLPRQQTLTPQNIQAHISLKDSTPYLLIHTVYLLCQIMLHREYVPFIPIRCSKPEGPLDPPTFPPEKYDVPPGFWEESARECFKAARGIMDLVRSCQEWNALVETPLVGFAIYTVAFTGVYCVNFPWMDPDGYMCTPPKSTGSQQPGTKKPAESKGFESARKALEMLGQMRTKLKMADGWLETILRVHKYIKHLKGDYRKNVSALESSQSEGDSPLSTRHLSLREGGAGGGLDEFKLLERTLKEFGSLEDQEIEMTESNQRSRLQDVYDDSSANATVKSEDAVTGVDATSEPPRSESGPWNAINAMAGPSSSRHASTSTPNSGQFRTYESYQPPQQQGPTPGPEQQQQPQPQLHSFRPVYPSTNTSIPSAPPSLVSPMAPTPSSASQFSPGFERPPYPASYAPQEASYRMHSLPGLYTNGIPNHQPHPTPPDSMGNYATTTHQLPPQIPLQGPMQGVQQPWNNPVDKETWLNNLDTRLGGDDFAAFVDGGDVSEWATMQAHRSGYDGGWLSRVYGANHGMH